MDTNFTINTTWEDFERQLAGEVNMIGAQERPYQHGSIRLEADFPNANSHRVLSVDGMYFEANGPGGVRTTYKEGLITFTAKVARADSVTVEAECHDPDVETMFIRLLDLIGTTWGVASILLGLAKVGRPPGKDLSLEERNNEIHRLNTEGGLSQAQIAQRSKALFGEELSVHSIKIIVKNVRRRLQAEADMQEGELPG